MPEELQQEEHSKNKVEYTGQDRHLLVKVGKTIRLQVPVKSDEVGDDKKRRPEDGNPTGGLYKDFFLLIEFEHETFTFLFDAWGKFVDIPPVNECRGEKDIVLGLVGCDLAVRALLACKIDVPGQV